ncbi:hypothetical protein [Lactobacillus jensenii]|uniref:Uncharacterized protein n=1 Tax=Lactobacillus jensenii TaxID=109790 RepID=A0ABU9FH89_LACJE|nr:hypothetical protein [Lactobacillus jensenii]DAR66722.1 MAG TPA: hypothetical protein [Caudoviricetes sp.]MCW8089599.1 hypothetical protein [Lactobacillus jensenii]MDK8236081.1 hypothetical protein [Lactobacillus jensenii]MDT9544369.1 hypothetical protein [Lactobacillus jensenii]MDT9586794.1 hypothetical protein [Lactobacillus jensenii]
MDGTLIALDNNQKIYCTSAYGNIAFSNNRFLEVKQFDTQRYWMDIYIAPNNKFKYITINTDKIMFLKSIEYFASKVSTPTYKMQKKKLNSIPPALFLDKYILGKIEEDNEVMLKRNAYDTSGNIIAAFSSEGMISIKNKNIIDMTRIRVDKYGSYYWD